MVSYTFAEGPFRDLVIRFGYDPRKDPEARLCVQLPCSDLRQNSPLRPFKHRADISRVRPKLVQLPAHCAPQPEQRPHAGATGDPGSCAGRVGFFEARRQGADDVQVSRWRTQALLDDLETDSKSFAQPLARV